LSRAPYVISKPDAPYSRDARCTTDHRRALPELEFIKQYGNHSMPETGDNVARDFGITREQSDEFALASQQKYAAAEKEGFYKGEIMAVALAREEEGRARRADVGRRASAARQHDGGLAKLKPLFEGGVVTAATPPA